MASEKKIRANRNNARASTGPRTARGKAKASRNAKKHGLSLSVLVDPSFLVELYNLGKEIVGENPSAELMEPACRIAAAQLDLVKIRQVRNVLLAEAAAILLCEHSTEGSRAKPPRVLDEIVRKLSPLDRYERRALSRRKQGIRDFDQTKRQLERGTNEHQYAQVGRSNGLLRFGQTNQTAKPTEATILAKRSQSVHCTSRDRSPNS